MEEKRKWKVSDISEILRNGFNAIIHGNLLLRLNVGKYFMHIAYTFLLFWILIFESLMAENALGKVERGKEKLHEMEIVLADKTFEAAMSSRRSAVIDKLHELGSRLEEPQAPATVIKKNGR